MGLSRADVVSILDHPDIDAPTRIPGRRHAFKGDHRVVYDADRRIVITVVPRNDNVYRPPARRWEMLAAAREARR
jgi:hypothetical protein